MSYRNHIRTLNERRAASAWLVDRLEFAEVFAFLRPRRGATHDSLPSEYDELKQSKERRCWKRWRCSQWERRKSK